MSVPSQVKSTYDLLNNVLFQVKSPVKEKISKSSQSSQKWFDLPISAKKIS